MHCQPLSLSAGLPLKAPLAMRGILCAWSGLSLLFHTWVQEGVGDTPDSYAYDGNRVRKWNVTTTNYGKVSSCPGNGMWSEEKKAGGSFSLHSARPCEMPPSCPPCVSPLLGRLCASNCTFGVVDVLCGCFV